MVILFHEETIPCYSSLVTEIYTLSLPNNDFAYDLRNQPNPGIHVECQRKMRKEGK